MKKLIFTFAILVVALGCSQKVSAQVGTWKNYLSYHDVQDVKRGGNMLYVLASNSLYTYNENDKSIQTYDKVNGLTDCGISRIEWNNTVHKLLIFYSDYNIDILDANGNITNISDYYNASISGNKDVNNIYMNDRYAYLSTEFGIVKIDMRDAEISDTYNLRFRVDYCYIDGNYIYAASSTNGLYRATQTSNLLDPNQWSRIGDYTAREYTVDKDLLAEANTLSPDGPDNNRFGFMRVHNGKLYTVAGGFDYSLDSAFPGYAQIYDNGKWHIAGKGLDSVVNHSFEDMTTIDVDPSDDNHFFIAGRSGLYEFRNYEFVREFTYDNSPLKSAATVGHDTKNYVLVFTIKFDNNGDLWVLNSQSLGYAILKYTKNGEWETYDTPTFMPQGMSLLMMNSAFFDRDNLLWFVNSHFSQHGVECYQPSTNGANDYTSFVNEDGTEITYSAYGGVRCAAEDMNGNIWVGTTAGPLYINYADKTVSPSELVFQQYKVPRNDGTDLADYLLTNVPIRSIAIDGANRKWFGTANDGVYLISSDNNTEVHHFLSTNSPLLDNTINSIAIDNNTGEVFFGTNKGLCSYVSDAQQTVDKMSKDVTYAYPNPVKPGYTGPITITGLTYDADVKIVTSNGVLVAQGRSNGGSFIWDGNDLKGKRVASGVYMVQTATSSGDKGTVCKIAIVN